MPDVLRLRLWLGWLALLMGLGEGLHAQPQQVGGPDAAYDLEDDYLIRSWTTADGLPINYIGGIAQTADGYLWLATGGGLVRFNGYDFTVFTREDLPGWTTNYVRSLAEDETGTLWIISYQGELVRRKDGMFERFGKGEGLPGEPVSTLLQACAGAVWFSAGGGLVRAVGESLAVYTTEDGLPGTHITNIGCDPDGHVVVSVKGGVHATYRDGRLHPYTLEPALAKPGACQALMAAACPQSTVKGRGGVLWVGRHEGLVRKGQDTTTIYTTADGFSDNPVDVVHESADGALWVGTRNGGVGRFTNGRFVPVSDGSLAGRGVKAIMEDAEGNLWFGTTTGLVCLTPRKVKVLGPQEGLPPEIVLPIREDRVGTMWVGTWGGGLSRVEHGRVTATYTTRDGLAGDQVRALHEDRRGRLWVGTTGGLSLWRGEGFETATDGSVHAMLESREGALWVAYNYGVGTLKEDGRGGFRYEEVWNNGWPIWALHEDRVGRLWVATQQGLGVREKGTWRTYTTADGLTSDFVASIYEDDQGALWFGTHGGGLNRLEADGRFTALTTRHGLYSDGVWRILDDGHGFYWMSSDQGLFRVAKREIDAFARGEADRVTSIAYTEADGMPSAECNRASPAGWKRRDGTLWFPTIAGVAVVDPGDIPFNERPPPVQIEQVVINGEPVTASGGAFAPGSENLEVSYAALSFVAPSKNRYRYKLEGYDHGWQEAGTRRTAFYTNLPPGGYTFRVIASNNDGVWNEVGVSFAFTLKPFFYQTLWFYLLCGLLGALAVVGTFRYRLQRLRGHELEAQVQERTSALEEEKKKTEAQAERLREMDRLKSRFFANVSHEFKTPLTMILGPVQDLLDGRGGAVDEAARRQLELARRHAQSLARLTEQLLDLSKLEAKGMALRKAPGDPAGFVREIVQSFVPLAERRGLTLTFQPEADCLPSRFDAEKLKKAVGNLLSNALKFTPEGGKVLVTVAGDEAVVQVRVRDTGPGIPADELPHVFDRFYQVDGSATRKHEGTGIGLSLAKELVELHGGAIEVTSEEGFGAEFVVTLPREQPGPAAQTACPALDAGSEPTASPFDGPTLVEPGGDGRPASPGFGGDATPEATPDATLREANGQVEEAGEPGADAPTVLIAEDNADVRAYLRQHLAPAYHLLEARNGAEALERARKRKPDLVLSDVMMPGMDGLALCRALKADDDLGDVPVLLLTAKGGAENRVGGARTWAPTATSKSRSRWPSSRPASAASSGGTGGSARATGVRSTSAPPTSAFSPPTRRFWTKPAPSPRPTSTAATSPPTPSPTPCTSRRAPSTGG